MYKKKLCVFFIVVVLISFSVRSQTTDNYVFKADFNNGEAKFPIGEKVDEKSFVKDGFYHLNVKDSTKSYRVYYEMLVNPETDFVLSSSIKFVSGQTDKTFGICFGYKDIDNANYFTISGNGNFRIYGYEGGEFKTLVRTTKNKEIKSNGELNVLLLERIGDKLYFFINYKQVATLPYKKFAGQNFGLVANGNVEMACDYFYIKQKRDPVNLIEGWDKFGSLVKMGSEINTKAGEIMPVVSADESHLYVTRKIYDSKGDAINDDAYVSELGKDSNWKVLRPLGKPINNASHNFVTGISQDNNELMVGGTYNAAGEWGGKGFSRSHRTKDGWSMPKKLEIKNYYNEDKHVEMCPSHDFKTILMAIKRKDSYGYKDIYFSFMLADSTWTEPVNLGKEINTFGNEDSPFLAPDNKTLYFSSEGWPGYGSNDIFMSKRLDDTWQHWSKPQNLGPKINSDGWDAYYTTSASGKYAYVVSNKSDENKADIYQIKQPESAKPEALLMVKGKVLNSKTKQPIGALITYSVLGTNKNEGRVSSDPETGLFSITLHKGKKYAFTAHKDGYISEHKSSDVVDLINYKEEEIDLLLTPFEKGESVIMHNLFFVANKAELLRESDAELHRLYELLSANPKMKVEIGGHTSINTLGDKWNQDLSFNRAKAVKDFLSKKGIEDKRVVAKGYGFTKLIDKTTGEIHQAKNRRVEFTILEK